MAADREKQSFASLAQEAEQLQQTMEYVSPEQMRSADRITLISPDGTVLYDSVARADAMENHLSREEVAQALREGTGKSSHYSSTVLKKNLYYALRLEDGNILRLSREQSSLGAMLLNMAWPIAATVAGLLLLAAGLSVRLARQITQPINAISPDDPQDVYPELQPLTQRRSKAGKLYKIVNLRFVSPINRQKLTSDGLKVITKGYQSVSLVALPPGIASSMPFSCIMLCRSCMPL